MESQFKRAVINDIWIPITASRVWLERGEPYEFQSYVLGFRFQATERELKLIEQNQMFGHWALQLRNTEPSFTFAELLAPTFIPEVEQSPENLLHVEGLVRAAAAKWSLFFESMDDPVYGATGIVP